MAFCETFKYYRKNKGYTQEEIANLLSVTAQAVSKWEMGVSMPDISLIVPIANIFGISTDLLLENFSKTEDDISSEIGTINSLNYK
ncbi:MAG: helix-turn-helix domain-containing protein, partial [Acutalibacteraceae bacterium]